MKPPWMKDLDQEQIDYMLSLEATSTLCKGRSRHRFPVLLLDKNGELPEGIDVRVTRGIIQLVETCEICGRWVRRLCDARGVVDYSVSPQYGGGQQGYIATGLGIPRGAYTLKMADDQKELIASLIKLQHKRSRALKAVKKAS
jgi:hypothetical protein